MSYSDLLTADEWLLTTLTGGTALMALVSNQVYDDSVPQGATYPLVQVRHLSDADTQTANGVIVMNRPLKLVVAVDRADQMHGAVDMTVLEAIYSECQTLLHRQSGTVARGDVWFAARDQGFRRRYVENGIEFRELGAMYRLWSQA